MTLPAASGGDGTLTYTLTPEVPGLSFNASTRQLTGTPSTAGTYAMTYTATDDDDDADSLTFTITVEESDDGDDDGSTGAEFSISNSWCTGSRVFPGSPIVNITMGGPIIDITMGGTLLANVSASSVGVTGFANGMRVGSDFLGSMLRQGNRRISPSPVPSLLRAQARCLAGWKSSTSVPAWAVIPIRSALVWGLRCGVAQGEMMKSSTGTTREHGFVMKALGNVAALLMTALLLVSAEAQSVSDTAFAEPGLKQLSFWAPENAFAAMFIMMLRSASYCEELPLQPEFQTEVARYRLDVPYNVDVNILAAPNRPGASIEMSLMSASGDSLSMQTAEGVSVDVDDLTLEIPRVWTIGREIASENFSVGGMPVGISSLDISVRNESGPVVRR